MVTMVNRAELPRAGGDLKKEKYHCLRELHVEQLAGKYRRAVRVNRRVHDAIDLETLDPSVPTCIAIFK